MKKGLGHSEKETKSNKKEAGSCVSQTTDTRPDDNSVKDNKPLKSITSTWLHANGWGLQLEEGNAC